MVLTVNLTFFSLFRLKKLISIYLSIYLSLSLSLSFFFWLERKMNEKNVWSIVYQIQAYKLGKRKREKKEEKNMPITIRIINVVLHG